MRSEEPLLSPKKWPARAKTCCCGVRFWIWLVVKLVALVLLTFLVYYVVNTLFYLDVNKRVYNHLPGPCRFVDGVENGSEDVVLVEEKGVAFISNGLSFLPGENTKRVKGQIYMYDFNQPKSEHRAMLIPIVGMDAKKLNDFHPHGMSHWALADGRIRLFIISHTDAFEHSVVVLDYDDWNRQLNYVRTIVDHKFIRPNDLAATGEDSFVVSNDGSAQSRFGMMLEGLTGWHRGSLVSFKNNETKYVLSGAHSMNGIAFSKSYKQLFVSHVAEEQIGVYSWNEHIEEVRLIRKVTLLTQPDNIHVQGENVLWVGAHPVLKDLVKHIEDPFSTNNSPSQVLRIEFSPNYDSWEVTEVLADDGRFVCGSSVAVPHDMQMLVGTIFRRLVHCELADQFVVNSKFGQTL